MSTRPSEFADSSDVADDEVLLRRVHPTWIDWKILDSADQPRLKRVAFQDYKNDKAQSMGLPGACMSIDIGSVAAEHGRAPADLLDAFGDEYGLVAITAGSARELDQGVMPWPTDDHPWHGVVYAKSGKRAPSIERALAVAATWIVIPPRGA